MFYDNRDLGDIDLMGEMVKYRWQNETVLFATKHGKEDILAPLLFAVDLACVPLKIDTDIFGTFSGEVERTGTVRETLRKKVRAAAEMRPEAKLLLASEGSFGPHPILGFVQTDLESLLLWHRDLNIEVYAEHLCPDPVHAEKVLGPTDDFRKFLKQIGFPEQGVIVRPEGMMTPIFKGLHGDHDVAQAILESFAAAENARVILAADLRADHNPTRRNAIREAGLKLVEKLQSKCPECECPGFAISSGVPGLLCAECAEPSPAARAVIWSCVKCDFRTERLRPDGLLKLDASECAFCNP